MGQEVKGGDLVSLPGGGTLRLPRIGDRVLVAFPGRGWLCPADVVTAPSMDDPRACVGVFVMNKHTPLQKLHHTQNVPHTSQGDGTEPVWYWPR